MGFQEIVNKCNKRNGNSDQIMPRRNQREGVEQKAVGINGGAIIIEVRAFHHEVKGFEIISSIGFGNGRKSKLITTILQSEFAFGKREI